jgi:hypothetical protein
VSFFRETAGAALVPCRSAAEPESYSMVACVMCWLFLPAKEVQKQKTHLPVSLAVGFASTRLELDF